MFTKKSVKDIDLTDKTVLLRTDFNVPVKDGVVQDDYRLVQALPTIQYLTEHKAKVVIISHLGRPQGARQAEYSLAPVAMKLKKLLPDNQVTFAPDCLGDTTKQAVKSLQSGQILLLENLRFHPEEESNDDGFAEQLAGLADIFVQDGFGVVHRAHASTEAITHHLPSVAGLLLEKEVATITEAMTNPDKPLMAVIGGAKIADKIDLLNRFIDIADIVAVGGAMANTFLLAKGMDIGKSIADRSEVTVAKDIMAKAAAKAKQGKFTFYLPQDCVVSKSLEDPAAPTRIVDWSTHTVAEVESYPKLPSTDKTQVAADELILDIGPFSGAFIAGAAQLAHTVIWNGTLGVTETKALQNPVGPFSHGSELVMDAMLGQFGSKPFSIVGGGDTVGYVQNRHTVDGFSHVSTGGGASLELMSGKKLPGIEALLNKDQWYTGKHKNYEKNFNRR